MCLRGQSDSLPLKTIAAHCGSTQLYCSCCVAFHCGTIKKTKKGSCSELAGNQHTHCCHPSPADLLLYETAAGDGVFKKETKGAIYCPNYRDTYFVSLEALKSEVLLPSTILLLQRHEYKYLLFSIIPVCLRDRSASTVYSTECRYLQKYVTRTESNPLTRLLIPAAPLLSHSYIICSSKGFPCLLLGYRQ